MRFGHAPLVRTEDRLGLGDRVGLGLGGEPPALPGDGMLAFLCASGLAAICLPEGL